MILKRIYATTKKYLAVRSQLNQRRYLQSTVNERVVLSLFFPMSKPNYRICRS